MGVGEFFGEVALFTRAKRTLSVRAKDFLEVFVLPKEDFLFVLQYFPDEEERFVAEAERRSVAAVECMS